MNNTQSDTTKTIGIFNDSFPPIMDGVSLTAQNYAYWLQKKNQPVCVVTPKSPNYTDNEPYPVLRYTSIPIIGRKPYRLGLPKMDLAFNTEINKISFGLVHAHCPFSSGEIALNIAKEQHIPLVATFHSKYRDDFEHSVRNKMIAGMMTKEVMRFFKKADEVWIPQASVEETIREYGFKGKVEVVGNGNDFDTNESIEPIKLNAKKKLNIKNGEIVLLYVGQHIWEKNLRMIVDSLTLIKDLPFKMFFIGTGYALEDLKQLINNNNLNSKVEFVGMISDREILKEYYAASDLFLFPSNYDTWSIVIREAAALQTPSLIIKGSTVADSIIDNGNGFLCDNTAESFANKLKEIIYHPELRKEIGLNASKTITRSWESVAEEVIDRYHNLIIRKCKN